jgi:hypothetical protein
MRSIYPQLRTPWNALQRAMKPLTTDAQLTNFLASPRRGIPNPAATITSRLRKAMDRKPQDTKEDWISSSDDDESVELSEEQQSHQRDSFTPRSASRLVPWLTKNKEKDQELRDKKQRSDEIDAYLHEEAEKMKRHLRVLVMGTYKEDGVFWKKMRHIEQPLSEDERTRVKSELRRKVRRSVKSLLFAVLDEMDTLQSPADGLTSPEMDRLGQKIRRWAASIDEDDDEAAIPALGEDDLGEQLKGIGVDFAVLQQRQLDFDHESFQSCNCRDGRSFWNYAKSRLTHDFEPSIHDWLHLDAQADFRLIWETQVHRQDHGGYFFDFLMLRSTCSRKWLHRTQMNLSAVVFVADLGVGFQQLLEDGSSFRLKEKMLFCDSISRSTWFRGLPIILVAANVAAFRTHLRQIPLKWMFPEYEGPDDDIDGAVDFVIEQFMEGMKGREMVKVYRMECLGTADGQGFLNFLGAEVFKDYLDNLA